MLFTLKYGDTVEVYGTEGARNKRKRQLEFLEFGQFEKAEEIFKKYNGLDIIVKPAGGGIVPAPDQVVAKPKSGKKEIYLIKMKKRGCFVFKEEADADNAITTIMEKGPEFKRPDKRILNNAEEALSNIGKCPVFYSESEEIPGMFDNIEAAIDNICLRSITSDFVIIEKKESCIFIFRTAQPDLKNMFAKIQSVSKKDASNVFQRKVKDADELKKVLEEGNYKVIYASPDINPVLFNGMEINAINDFDTALQEYSSERKSFFPVYKFYIDGSYNPKTNRAGYGIVVLNGESIVVEERQKEVFDRDFKLMRNVCGELSAMFWVLEYIKKKDIKKAEIYCDYIGLIKWTDGSWTPQKNKTIEYKNLVEKTRERCEINFHKVKAHSGDKYNNKADRLAKSAIKM